MRIAKLIELVEKCGGRFTIENRQISLGWAERLTAKQRQRARQLDQRIRKQVYLVTCELLEREYARRWQREVACHCPARLFAHPPHRSEDVWQELRTGAFGKTDSRPCVF